MYRLGETKRSHRKLYLWTLTVAALLLAGTLGGIKLLKPSTTIGDAPAPVITKIAYDNTKLTTFDEKLFSLKLPADWKPTTHDDIPQATYTWQGTQKDNKSRWLELFVDAPVSKYAVNRALNIQANQTKINVLGDVSDNCTTFTGATGASAAQGNPQNHGSVLAKWQGIDFLCDTGNYQRDVVGTVSSNGLNTVILTGSMGTHNYYFVYTDSSPQPDYSIFTNALKSFMAK